MHPKVRGGGTSKGNKGKGKAVEVEEAPTYDTDLFESLETQDRYMKGLAKKKLIPERGIEFHQFSFGDQFVRRKWEKLASTPEVAVQQIVREFYANGCSIYSTMVFVRGQTLNCAPGVINKYYGTPRMREDEFSVLKEGADPQEIASVIARPGAQWEVRGPNSRSLHHGDLIPESRALLKFICARLLPAMHITEITWAVLIYCILTDKTIDIGDVIHQAMRITMRGSTTGGYGFPSLITGLCAAQRVHWETNEVLLKPMTKISTESVRNVGDGNVAISSRPKRQRGTTSVQDQHPNSIEELCDWVQQIDMKVNHLKNVVSILYQSQQRMETMMANMSKHWGIQVQSQDMDMAEGDDDEDDDDDDDDDDNKEEEVDYEDEEDSDGSA